MLVVMLPALVDALDEWWFGFNLNQLLENAKCSLKVLVTCKALEQGMNDSQAIRIVEIARHPVMLSYQVITAT